jgi:hypothetical protein
MVQKIKLQEQPLSLQSTSRPNLKGHKYHSLSPNMRKVLKVPKVMPGIDQNSPREELGKPGNVETSQMDVT